MNNANTSTQASRFGSGQAIKRLEDDALLRGEGRYTDDVSADEAHLIFVRSPYPHARLGSIDTSAALAMPGVLQVFTGADLVAAGVKPMAGVAGFFRAGRTPAASPLRRALAHEVVRFVGEPVAAVVALTRQQARDAAEAVMVDYEELPMVVNVKDALAGSAVLCPEAPDNIVAESRYGSAEATAQAFGQAAHVVKLAITNQRLAALTIEPRSVLAQFDAATERLTVRMSTQMPSGVRNAICDCLGLPGKPRAWWWATWAAASA